jgi:hypothetical protein
LEKLHTMIGTGPHSACERASCITHTSRRGGWYRVAITQLIIYHSHWGPCDCSCCKSICTSGNRSPYVVFLLLWFAWHGASQTHMLQTNDSPTVCTCLSLYQQSVCILLSCSWPPLCVGTPNHR